MEREGTGLQVFLGGSSCFLISEVQVCAQDFDWSFLFKKYQLLCVVSAGIQSTHSTSRTSDFHHSTSRTSDCTIEIVQDI